MKKNKEGWSSGVASIARNFDPLPYSLAAGVGYARRIFDLDHFEFTVEE